MNACLIDDESTLAQVMAWCLTAPSHYLSQCWPRSISPYGLTRLQWVNHQTWAEFILEKIKIYLHFFIISQHWICADSWNRSSWKARTCWSCKANIMVADDLVIQSNYGIDLVILKNCIFSTRRPLKGIIVMLNIIFKYISWICIRSTPTHMHYLIVAFGDLDLGQHWLR